MRAIVCGACGRMGRALRQMIEDSPDWTLAAAVDPYGSEPNILPNFEHCPDADVILDFSHHAGTGALLAFAEARGIPVVIATTGHTPEELAAIAEAAKKIPVFRSGNMSVGVALLCNLAKKAAAVFPDADIEIVETHHNHKLDAPSGTALMLAEAIGEARENAPLQLGRAGNCPRNKGEIGIHAVRRGEIVGIHEVLISTPTQTVTLRHEAHTRALFAEGALAAGAFLCAREPGLYNMQSMIDQES